MNNTTNSLEIAQTLIYVTLPVYFVFRNYSKNCDWFVLWSIQNFDRVSRGLCVMIKSKKNKVNY